MNDMVEFSRLFPLSRLGDTAASYVITASAEECHHLASRFDLLSLNNLVVDLQLSHGEEPQSYILKGELDADIVQACIITLQDVSNHVHMSINTILLPSEHGVFQGDQEMDEDKDYEPLYGDKVELGEIAAQHLALALDHYPRHPSVPQEKTSFGDAAEQPPIGMVRPFQALANLKLD